MNNVFLNKVKMYTPFSFSSPYQKASVAIIIIKKKDDYYIVFTKRPDDMREHAGEISFPGGRIEGVDKTLLDTALRETEEEIGLALEEDEYLGRIDDLLTISKYHVYPFVFYVERSVHYHKSLEIAELIEIPLSHLLDSSNCKVQDLMYKNEMRELYWYHYKDYVVWGATGLMLNNFLSIFRS